MNSQGISPKKSFQEAFEGGLLTKKKQIKLGRIAQIFNL